MRTSKYVGFLAISLGALIIVGAAVLPVSPAARDFGPFRIHLRGDNCGPAAVAAVRQADTPCGLTARNRLLGASAAGLVVVAVGMALFAGGDQPHGSRIQVSDGRPKRRPSLRSPGAKRYRPG